MISKLVEAVREGKIELADDEETEDTEETEEESEESESEYSDNTNDTDTNENIPEARKKAIIKARKAFEKKQPTSKEMLKYLVEYYGKDNEADIKALGAEELADLYLDTKLCFIDDEGKEHESAEGAPYPRNGEFACCGAVLQYDEEKSQYVCTVCGEVYEAE
jgi:uncharacterized protein with von Willebrand factor type A (vWA) domain